MKNRVGRQVWLGLWLGLLAALLVGVLGSLRLSTDLRLFLPRPGTPEQALVLEGVGEGPAARLLMIALEDAEPAELAHLSHALVAGLRGNRQFRLVTNGSGEIPSWLDEYRYLLTTGFDDRPLDAASLRAALEDRLRDLSSPAAPALETLVPSDPTLEIATIASRLAPRRPLRTVDGAWFDAAGRRALLIAQTQAAGFDPDGQQRALRALEEAFRVARVVQGSDARMMITGPGQFSALMKEHVQCETAWLGTMATAGLLVILIVGYRRWRVAVLAPLPLAGAALAGLAAVGFVYGEVHGITLAFGFTLIGVAQDYPIHFFSHQHAGLPPIANARHLWPTLATGVVATCIAYAAFLASGVTGLAQLGLFSITGLAVAGLTTRYLLPRASGEDFRDPARSPALVRLESRLSLSLPRLRPLAYAAILGACIAAAVFAPGAAWQDDLGALTPVPPKYLAADAALRAELGAPDPRFLAVVTAPDAESALQKLEALDGKLEELVAGGAIGGFDHAARHLPSGRRQRERRARLPSAQELRAAIATASAGMPFRDGVFAPFSADVERTRTLPPLTPESLRATEQGPLIEGLLHQRERQVQAVIAFSAIGDPARLREWARAAGPDTMLVDLKQETAALASAQRSFVLRCLAVAAALLVLVVGVALRSARRVARVLAPMALTTAAIVAVLRLSGTPLDLFHLMSLVLAAGLGIDYALYFERTGNDRDLRLRTLHAVLVCSLSTLLVFALLSFSAIPVLRSIGITVTLGVVLSFLLALALPREPAGAR